VDKRFWALILTLAVTACQSTPTPLAAPPELEMILVTPPLLPQTAEWIRSYQGEIGQLLFNLIPMPYITAIETLEEEDAGVVIASQSPPSDWWAIPLGTEPIAVVVHPSNTVQELTQSELIQILSGQVVDWEPWTGQPQPIAVIFPLPDDETRTRFLDLLSPGIRLLAGARLAPNPTTMAEWVEQEPGSLGIMPYSLFNDSLTAIEIDGAQPGEFDYPFSIDIIATSPQEPEGSLRDWLLWLQERFLEVRPTSAELDISTPTREATNLSPSESPLGTTTASPTSPPVGTQTP
jgi:ABC-type phosphate transport system substrate-binding protein